MPSDLEMFTTEPAPVVDVERRIIRGLAVPYGVNGHPRQGVLMMFSRGAVRLPSRLSDVKLYRDHRKADGSGEPVGVLTAVEDTDAGQVMTFSVAEGPEGDRALREARPGSIRDGLSIEARNVRKDGRRITYAELEAVAIVGNPAFQASRVTEVIASATPPPPIQEAPDMPNDTTAPPATEPAPATSQPPAATEPTGDTLAASAAPPAPLVAPSGVPLGRGKRPELTLSRVADVLTTASQGTYGDQEIAAALADITRSAHPWVSPDQWVGELWDGVAYQREVVPLLTRGVLNSWKALGWRWIDKPTVADYTGDKTEVPSNTVSTESVEVSASRLAGAHDIDRKYWDFRDTEFINSYFRALTESYAYQSDSKAGAFLAANARTIYDDAPTNTVEHTEPDILRAVAFAAQHVKIAARTSATFVLVNPLDMIGLLDYSALDAPEFLSTLGINPARFTASEFVAQGTVIVGAKPAVTFYELPGSPIRVETVDIAKGGRDAGVFGYYALLLNNAKGLVKVSFGA